VKSHPSKTEGWGTRRDAKFFFTLDLLESWSYAKNPAKSLSLKDLEVKSLFLNDLAGFFAWRAASAAG
jgi:hypothetical protein